RPQRGRYRAAVAALQPGRAQQPARRTELTCALQRPSANHPGPTTTASTEDRLAAAGREVGGLDPDLLLEGRQELALRFPHLAEHALNLLQRPDGRGERVQRQRGDSPL